MTTSTTSGFHRPISPTERLYLSGQQLASPFAIQLIVEGAGCIGLDALTAAVTKASAACPGSRLVRSGSTWVDTGRAPHVEMTTGTDLDLDDPDAHELFGRPLGPRADATTEVVLVRGRRAALVFRAFHGVMDAKGLTLWASDVFRALRGEAVEGAPDVTADHTLVERLGRPGKATRLLPTFPSPIGPGAPIRGHAKFGWRHRTVTATPGTVVARIGAVLAASADAPVRLMVPVDLRRHDPSIRSTANLALPLFLTVAPGQDWTQVNAQMLIGLVEKRELNEMDNGGLGKFPPVVTRGVLRAVHSLGSRRNLNLVSAIVSHAGTIDLDDFAAPGFTPSTVRALPVHTGMVPLSFVALEAGGRTEITASCRTGVGIEPRLDALLDRIAQALEKEVTTSSPADEAVERNRQSETVVGLFAARLAENPEAIAVKSPERDYTYADLDARSAGIAAQLSARGIGPGSIVAVISGRTFAGIAGQLGIMRAGSAFLPLDPKHPRARIRETLQDSGAALALVETDYADIPNVLSLDLGDIAPGEPGDECDVTPTDSAFVTYTSGSTGRPKGVVVTHGGVANYVASATEWFALGPETRFAHYHTPAADMACAAFLSPLLRGGTIVLVPDDVSHVSLREMLCDSGANTFLLTPSLLEVIVRLGIGVPPPRTVIIGGELLVPDLAARARSFFGPTTRLLNSYGPTEVSIVCTTHVIGDRLDTEAPSVPIGYPAIDTRSKIVDSSGQEVGEGQVGELLFGGPQVARGYLNRPDLTAERFVTSAVGERFYRTGDLARRLPNGELEFVGRVDHQVKIRGNRVEPGEVRAAIVELDGVGHAAVTAVRRPDGGNVLAAYVVADGTLGEDPEATVRDHLATRLPTYMIPATLSFVEALPLTSNGKLDVTLLEERHTGERAEAPESTVTDPAFAAVTQIWSNALSVDAASLGPSSDFFALGGDSLASVEMLAKVSRDIVGRAGEQVFVAQLEGLIHHLTLGRVHEAAVAAKSGADG
ncbi:non-ribosomal peptide synthetase [Rhodococcus sp. NPDC058521]|uniref:non-ribosomal peptide synthetase n=1 Tax=Rhodococcus sp. NPDC058521 TaxID=3346536 RepID=UPI00365CDC44